MSDLVFYRDVPIVIKCKGPHATPKGKSRNGIYKCYGDIPVAVYNSVTEKFMEVVNGRGNAYALRSAFCYRKK
jgi:hypothetical protein